MSSPSRRPVPGETHPCRRVVRLTKILAGLLGALALPAHTPAQPASRIVTLEPDQAITDAPITITATIRRGEEIERIYLVCRPFGAGQYQRAEMDLVGNNATITLPSRLIVPPFLEFYLVLVRRDGSIETDPEGGGTDPFAEPPLQTLQLPVLSQDELDTQVIFLSPDAAEVLNSDDVVISLSLLRADSAVARSATQVFLDGANVSDKVIMAGDLLVLVPGNFGVDLSPGVHRIGIRLYRRDGNLYRVAVHRFTVLGEEGYQYTRPVLHGFRPTMTVDVESRREGVGGSPEWYNRAGLQFSGQTGVWRVLAHTFVTSDERSDRQPQNRYFVGVESPWFAAGYGDSYPSFPDLILRGKRVRGLSSAVRLGALNVDVAYGQISRPLEGTLVTSFPTDSLVSEQQRNPTAAYGPVDATHWGRFLYGTYERNLFAVRPSFGSGDPWQWGITWLSARDDPSSIQYGIRPQENILLGTDVVTRFDRGRIEFRGQAAFSAFNTDISSGTFTDAYIDTVYPHDAGTIKSVRNLLQDFITINDNLRPLSLKTPATLAYDIGVDLNYFDNFLRVGYVFRGSDYTSFGQTFLRRDIRGVSVLDRLRLLENVLHLTAGFERLQDNTAGTKVATTAFTTFTAAVGYYPRGGLPGISAGISSYSSDNGLSSQGTDSLSMVDDATLRFFTQVAYDVAFHGTHSAALSFSTSSRKDRSPRRYDVRNTAVSLGVRSRYPLPLQTTLEAVLSFNAYPDSIQGWRRDLDYTTLVFGARYELLRDLVVLTATVAPSLGDVRRLVTDAGVEWFAMPSLVLAGQFSYFRNEGLRDDSIFSLRARYDL
jgi:hypothetical protein